MLRTNRLRADTTVVEANVSYPSDSGLLALTCHLGILRLINRGAGSEDKQ